MQDIKTDENGKDVPIDEIVSMIIDKHRFFESQLGNGKSALNHVLLQPLSKRTYEIMEKIIKYGAKINYLDDSDNFPLKILMTKHAKNIYVKKFVKFLIEKGAKTDFKDKNGKTAYDYAMTNKETDTIVLKSLKSPNAFTKFFSTIGGVKKRSKTKRSNKNKRSQKTKSRNFRKT